jgi:hypothetical protein
MAGTAGRPPYTGVGQGVRWQGGRRGFLLRLAGMCGESFEPRSAAQSAGCLAARTAL